MSIGDLPDEMLEQVFSHLKLSDRENARLVCRHWRDVFYSPSLTENVQITLSYYSDLNELNFSGRYTNIKIKKMKNKPRMRDGQGITFKEDCAEFWSKCGQYVKSLSMFYVGEQSEFLRDIFPNTPNLESLSLCDHDDKNFKNTYRDMFDMARTRKALRDSPLESDELALNMLNQLNPFEVRPPLDFTFPKLQSLKIEYNKGLTSEQFRNWVEKAPMLKRLSLYSRNSKDEKDLLCALDVFTNRQQNHLIGLSLNLFELKDSNLKNIVLNLGPQMVELDLHGCRNITDICLPLISERFPKLQKIDLSCTQCSDGGISDLLKSLEHVAHVYLERTLVSRRTAAVIPAMTQLRVLSLAGSKQHFDELCVRTAFMSKNLQLTELDLSLYYLTDQLVGEMVSFLPNLKALYWDNYGPLCPTAAMELFFW